MNCQDVLERMGEYRDLAAGDPAREAIDRHIRECESCRAEFLFWQRSAELIRTVGEPEGGFARTGSVAARVMARIYETESWRKPVAQHVYSLSWRVRRNIMVCFAMCLALFFASLFFVLVPDAGEANRGSEFSIQVVTVVAQGQAPDAQAAMFQDSPVVSIGPTVLFTGKAQTFANVYLAASVLGVIVTLLLMNWLSRLRA
jgi:hypothetical protein